MDRELFGIPRPMGLACKGSTAVEAPGNIGPSLAGVRSCEYQGISRAPAACKCSNSTIQAGLKIKVLTYMCVAIQCRVLCLLNASF
jgi:hypothetical protein